MSAALLAPRDSFPPPPVIERRVCRSAMSVRGGEATPGSAGVLTGYAAVFNKWSEELGYFQERIAPGAFADTLARGDDVRALVDHNSGMVVGRRSAKTLTVGEDAAGLAVSINVPDTTVGRDLVTSVKRGDLTGMSFGFNVVDDEWARETVDGATVYKRTLKAVDLIEVSVVAFPAYPQTSVAARSAAAPDVLAALERGKRLVESSDRSRHAGRDALIASFRAAWAASGPDPTRG